MEARRHAHDDGILSAVLRVGIPVEGRNIRIVCPFCTPSRKREHQRDRTLSVSQRLGRLIYVCHHCSEDGFIEINPNVVYLPTRQSPTRPKVNMMAAIAGLLNAGPTPGSADIEPINAPVINEVEWDDGFIDFLTARKLTLFTGQMLGVKPCIHYFGTNQRALAFPYVSPKSGLVYAYKVRSIETKDFRCVGTPQSMFLADKAREGEPVYITEGEFDAWAFHEAGLCGASVPHGAPNKPMDLTSGSEDRKLACIWNSRSIFQAASKVVIAGDCDIPGQLLSEEIARRLGKAKVHRVDWEGGKDANDVLMARGIKGLKDQAEASLPWPLEGVRAVSDFTDDVLDLYRNGNMKGISTGLANIDPLYTIAPGLMTVLTGHPASGKSEWLDYVMIQMAVNHGWKFAICSFENPVRMHLAKLAEKVLQEPFFEGYHPKMSEDALRKALAFLNQHFVFLDFSDGSPATIEVVLERADLAVQRLGCRGLVIDPFNYLTPSGNEGWSPMAISDMLTHVKRFGTSHDAHVWMIAHPAKMARQGEAMPIPGGMDISGAYAWWAKADHGITIHRQDGGVMFRSWKARFKWLGSHGDATMIYDSVTGTYSAPGQFALPEPMIDLEPPPFPVPEDDSDLPF